MPDSSAELRSLPSVDRVLRDLGDVNLPRPLVASIIREVLADLRESIGGGQAVDAGDVLKRVRDEIEHVSRSRLMPVINGTGIVIHTNLGRTPMGQSVADAVAAAATQYGNLEFDLSTGERGPRGPYLERALAVLCQAEAATVVNNCAAGLVLMLRHFTAAPQRKAVIVSRGELVQIGGGFRVPEILEASGAVLREVGTTNKTTIDDYRRAIDPSAAMILRVHRSNFFMDGFVESPDGRALAELAHGAGLVFVEDLGSGAMFDTTTIGNGVEREPTPSTLLAAGADLVCFSGDKLFGGPQAGILVGRREWINTLKREPFFRALRCDKLVFAALQATVDLLLRGQTDSLPLRTMLDCPLDPLRERAQKILSACTGPAHSGALYFAIVNSVAQVGGGALPRTRIESIAIAVTSDQAAPQHLAARLRAQGLPVVAHVTAGTCQIDLRTVLPQQDGQLIGALSALGRALGTAE